MTTLLAESTGTLTIAVGDQRLDELAFRSAADIVVTGDSLVVVDAAGCFDPARMTHSARIGALDPAGLMRHLHIIRARTADELELAIGQQIETAFMRFGTRQVLITDLLGALYDNAISTRDASHILGRIKLKLEELAEMGAQIVVLCRPAERDLGTRAHFMSSLRASADRVYLRSNT